MTRKLRTNKKVVMVFALQAIKLKQQIVLFNQTKL